MDRLKIIRKIIRKRVAKPRVKRGLATKSGANHRIVRNNSQGLCELSRTVSPLIIIIKKIIIIITYYLHAYFCAHTRVRRSYFSIGRGMYCENMSFVVPSGTIKQKMSTGTVTVKHTVYFRGGKNEKPRYWRKNEHYQKETEMNDPHATLSAQHRPGSPVCGNPAAFRAVGWTGTRRNLRKTERGIDPINSRNER